MADIGGWTVDLMQLDHGIPNAATCRSLELGVIQGRDMTSEAAMTKLMWAIGQGMNPEEIKALAQAFLTQGNYVEVVMSPDKTAERE